MGVSAMDELLAVLLEMLKHPPDPNEPVPPANRRGTMYGVLIPFHIMSWIAVGFRLHTRFRIVREPGWDDALVVLAAVMNLVTLIAFFISVNNGIGQHIIFILPILQSSMMWFYVVNAAYTTTTFCIKLSLLVQYLRLFVKGYRRIITKTLLVLVILWGAVFSFMAWFPCFPVSGFWNKQNSASAKCYGFGYRTVQEAKNVIFAFAGSNMVLDLAILAIPLTEYFKPGLKKQQVLAMTGLFMLGSIVVLMAILRLWSGLKNDKTGLMFDITWWLPELLMFSCLEVDFAIMCASMPIFWPSVMAAWTEIFVTHEVHVTHDRRSQYLDNNPHSLDLGRAGSTKSHNSREGLTSVESREGKSWFVEADVELGPGPGIPGMQNHRSGENPRRL